MKLRQVILVSGNKAKAGEVQRILKIPVKVLSIDLEEIQDLDLEKIALNKLNQAYKIIGKPVIVDDVSVEIQAWSNFPGPLIKWLLHAGGGDDAKVLLKMLEGEKDRRAKAKLAIGFHDGKNAHIFIGEVSGSIATEVRGNNGFGWDPVFIPDGYVESFAEMDPKTKDSVSHRGKALEKLSDFINRNYEI